VETTPELELDYPCQWEYKLILSTEHDVTLIVREILEERIHTVRKSQNSNKGNYASYTLSVLVHNADDRKMLYHTLKAHKHIKFVL
jgi:putative lipoic acid-binding regulatory protein